VSLVNDVALGGLQLNVAPGSYRKRNKRTGGRPASFERITLDRFAGQRAAFADDVAEGEGFSWDGVGVGPAFDGRGVEPYPNFTAFVDGVIAGAGTPSLTRRAHGAIAGNNAFFGIGQFIYKSVLLSNGAWANVTQAADLGVGFVVSGLAYFQDDLLVMLSSGQEIRKFNTSSNGLTIWRTGERGQVGAGYAGQLK
jgi:hypothetical protein